LDTAVVLLGTRQHCAAKISNDLFSFIAFLATSGIESGSFLSMSRMKVAYKQEESSSFSTIAGTELARLSY